MAKIKIKYVGRDDRSGIEFIFTLPGFAPVRGGDPGAAAKHFFLEMASKLGPGGRCEWVVTDHAAYAAAFASGIRGGHVYYQAILIAGATRTTARIDMTVVDISDESRLLPDTARSKPPSKRLRDREIARTKAAA
jgi:hypothetical protein